MQGEKPKFIFNCQSAGSVAKSMLKSYYAILNRGPGTKPSIAYLRIKSSPVCHMRQSFD